MLSGRRSMTVITNIFTTSYKRMWTDTFCMYIFIAAAVVTFKEFCQKNLINTVKRAAFS